MGAFIINQQTKAQRLPEFGELFEEIVEPRKDPNSLGGACGWCLRSGLWPRGREWAPGSSCRTAEDPMLQKAPCMVSEGLWAEEPFPFSW